MSEQTRGDRPPKPYPTAAEAAKKSLASEAVRAVFRTIGPHLRTPLNLEKSEAAKERIRAVILEVVKELC